MVVTRFNVSSRIALLLGESYKRIEQALKELVDNSWDADAKTVHITVPEGPEPDARITNIDTGEGLTPEQIERDYLRIARDRRKDRGPKTASGRLVKGRKGVGKFAGIIVAGRMELITQRGGKQSTIVIARDLLEKGPQDIDQIDVPIAVCDVDRDLHGTAIILSELLNHINYPTPEAMRHALAPEYGRQDLMKVFVNGERLSHLQIEGHALPKVIDIAGVGAVRAEFMIADKKQKRNIAASRSV